MAVLARNNRSRSRKILSDISVMIGGRERSLDTYLLQLSNRVDDLTLTLREDILDDKFVHSKIARALACSRLLKPTNLDTHLFETAKYCRQYRSCKVCEWNRASDFADRREATHREGGQPLADLRCFECIVHYQPCVSRDQSILSVQHANDLASKFLRACRRYSRDYRGTICDCVTGIHLKATPYAAIQQPHLHCVLLASKDARVKDFEQFSNSWFDQASDAAEFAADQDPSAPRLRHLTASHLGRVVPEKAARNATKGKAITVAHVKNLIQYTLRLSERADQADDVVDRLSLLRDAGIRSNFNSFRIGSGQAEGPNEYSSETPLIVCPFDSRPRLLWPQYRKEVLKAIQADAIRLVEVYASATSDAPSLSSSIPEHFLFPPETSLQQANAQCVAEHRLRFLESTRTTEIMQTPATAPFSLMTPSLTGALA